MDIRVDATRCQGYGQCHEVCPEVFGLDEWGYAQVDRDAPIPPELEPAVHAAAAACPERAITIAGTAPAQTGGA